MKDYGQSHADTSDDQEAVFSLCPVRSVTPQSEVPAGTLGVKERPGGPSGLCSLLIRSSQRLRNKAEGVKGDGEVYFPTNHGALVTGGVEIARAALLAAVPSRASSDNSRKREKAERLPGLFRQIRSLDSLRRVRTILGPAFRQSGAHPISLTLWGAEIPAEGLRSSPQMHFCAGGQVLSTRTECTDYDTRESHWKQTRLPGALKKWNPTHR